MEDKTQMTLPGFEEFVEEEKEVDYFKEGVDKRFFDAAELDGAPTYQENAHGSQTYILHLIFPTREHLLRAINAFTLGERKGLLPTARLASINGIAENDNGNEWLSVWEKAMYLYVEDEAQAPI